MGKAGNAAGDMVNHPKHYTIGGIEVIDCIEAWELEFHEANVVKYVARAKHKGNRLEDLKKARFYLERKIRLLEDDRPPRQVNVSLKTHHDGDHFWVGE